MISLKNPSGAYENSRTSQGAQEAQEALRSGAQVVESLSLHLRLGERL